MTRLRFPVSRLLLLPLLTGLPSTDGLAQERLTARAHDNLVAFTRLYGYVRWFHPSEQSLTADWTAIAVDGARVVEAVASPSDLAASLRRIFATVAPTVQLFETHTGPDSAGSGAPRPSGDGVAWWRHRGVRIGPNQLYTSHLTIAPTGESPAGVPTEPYRLDLPGGVSALVPGLLGVSVPTMAAERARLPQVDTAGSRYAVTERATRFGAVIIAWNAVQHFYPYFDVMPVDWTGALSRALTRAAPDQDRLGFEATLKRMMAELRDGHGMANIQPWRELMSPPFDAHWIEDRLVVTAIDPSVAGRLSPGDVITHVNGEPADRVLMRQDSLSQGSRAAAVRWVATVTLLAGEPGSVIALQLEPGTGAPPRRVDVRRDQPVPPTSRPAPLTEIRPGIWYVDLTRSRDTTFVLALPQLARARGVIFDLRGYPSMSRRFIRHLIGDTTRWGTRQMSMPNVMRPDHQAMTFTPAGTWVMAPAAPRIAAPAVFLTDERAGSFAESLLDLIQEHRLGPILGSPSAGTNGDMNWFTVPGNYRIVFTGLKVIRHDGTRLHGVGIEPEVRVTPTIAGIRAGRDEVLERGIGLLR